jgi:hypothetical protein
MSTERSLRSDPGRGCDDTTRYLCAAAHLDARFADGAIREFLTEPTRVVPPVAGVRAGAVLAEAVAARARRKVRDAVLVTLFAGVLVTLSLSLVIAWLLVGVIVVLRRSAPGRSLLPAAGGGLVALGLLALLVWTDGAATSYSFDAEFTPAAAIALGLLVVLLAVLLVDEYVVWHHIEERFVRGLLLPDPSPDALSPQVRRVFYFGARTFLVQLRRHLHGREQMAEPSTPDDAAPVIVTRGDRVFVGAGEPRGPWSLAVPLRPRADAERVRPLCVGQLYERAMSSAQDVLVTEQVVVSAENPAEDFVSSPSGVPYPLLRGQRVRELRDQPLEWARYYLCFRPETGDRDVVVSAFLHLAVSDTTLYVEWTPCVLPPLREEYRAIDTTPATPLVPVGRAVLRFLTLPMTMPGRLRTVCSVIRPRRGAPMPAAYSLRELAADTGFQLPDRDRYLEVLESRVTAALAEAVNEAGYEAPGLARRHEWDFREGSGSKIGRSLVAMEVASGGAGEVAE